MSSESAKLGESMETSVKPEADRMKPVASGRGANARGSVQGNDSAGEEKRLREVFVKSETEQSKSMAGW